MNAAEQDVELWLAVEILHGKPRLEIVSRLMSDGHDEAVAELHVQAMEEDLNNIRKWLARGRGIADIRGELERDWWDERDAVEVVDQVAECREVTGDWKRRRWG